MNDRSSLRAQPSARGRQAVSDGNNRRSEYGLPPARKGSSSTKPAGLSGRRAGVLPRQQRRFVWMPGTIDQLAQYRRARRLEVALALVDDKPDRIMPSDEREMAAADAARAAIGSRPLCPWTLVDVKRQIKARSLYTVRCAIAYLIMECEVVPLVDTGCFGGRLSYCHPDYLEVPAS